MDSRGDFEYSVAILLHYFSLVWCVQYTHGGIMKKVCEYIEQEEALKEDILSIKRL